MGITSAHGALFCLSRLSSQRTIYRRCSPAILSFAALALQELLGASRVVASGSLGKGAKAAKDTVKDKVEDVQEAWETSQVSKRKATKVAVDVLTLLRATSRFVSCAPWRIGTPRHRSPDFALSYGMPVVLGGLPFSLYCHFSLDRGWCIRVACACENAQAHPTAKFYLWQ